MLPGRKGSKRIILWAQKVFAGRASSGLTRERGQTESISSAGVLNIL